MADLISINLPLAPKTVIPEAILIENLNCFNAKTPWCKDAKGKTESFCG